MDEGRRCYVGQKAEETTDGKSVEACVVTECVYGLWSHWHRRMQEEMLQTAETNVE